MEKSKREILALGLLVLLGIGVSGVMAWYMLVGHNWNKAASHIDDLVGSMDGYTVVVFEGVLQPSNNTLSSSSTRTSGQTTSKSSVAADQDAPSDTSSSSSASAPSANAQESGQSAGKDQSSKSASKKPVPLKKVVASYREKGATVLTLHLDKLFRYSDPMVVAKDGKRYGIALSQGKYRYVDVRDKLRALDVAEADFKIVISDSATIKKNWLRDVDLVVLACNGRIGSGGDYISSSFFVNSPEKGKVQAVIVSPSGTITSKTITEL